MSTLPPEIMTPGATDAWRELAGQRRRRDRALGSTRIEHRLKGRNGGGKAVYEEASPAFPFDHAFGKRCCTRRHQFHGCRRTRLPPNLSRGRHAPLQIVPRHIQLPRGSINPFLPRHLDSRRPSSAGIRAFPRRTFLHSSKRAFASSRLTVGALLRGMAFLLVGKPSGRTTLTVIDGILHARLPKTHRPMPDGVPMLMDRAYESNETRQLVLDLGMIPVVPPKSTRLHPWDYDHAISKKLNEIERLFRRLKGFRRIFSRFEKLDVVFLGFLSFALIVEALRVV